MVFGCSIESFHLVLKPRSQPGVYVLFGTAGDMVVVSRSLVFGVRSETASAMTNNAKMEGSDTGVALMENMGMPICPDAVLPVMLQPSLPSQSSC